MQPVRLGASARFIVAGGVLAAAFLAPFTLAQSVLQTPQQALETPQQTNDRIRALSSEIPRTPVHDYVIGSGDTITIQVFEVPELSRDLRVSQTGSIGLPLVPTRVHIAGLTELQAEVKISEILEANGLVSHAQVSVAVKDRKSKPITIVGAVPHAMVYQADHPVTLLEVLAEAGGIAGDAGDTVIITRGGTPGSDVDDSVEPPSLSGAIENGAPASPANNSSSDAPKETPAVPSTSQASGNIGPAAAGENMSVPPPLNNTITVNLNQLLETGNLQNNVPVFPGDVITVPHAGIIYVLGAVTRPGGFVVSNDRAQLSTLKVLSLAGGMSHSARADHAVVVRKDSNGVQHEINVDLSKVLKFQAEDVRLQPSDILYVPNSNKKSALIRTGEIAIAVATGALIYRVTP